MIQKYCIGQKEALMMVSFVRESIEVEGQAGAVAVTDAHGELVAFLRMDGCLLSPGSIAINKAYTAAREGKASGAVGQAAVDNGFPMSNFCDDQYTGWHGGYPIVYQGQTIGAIGISGIDQTLEISLGQRAAALIEAPR